MSLRTLVRHLRFYYKPHSRDLYRQAFQNHESARWFPFFGDGRFIPRNGVPPIIVPRRRWSSLSTAARLVLMNAYPKWDEESLTIEWNGLVFTLPAAERWTPGVLLHDTWRTKSQDLAGKIVIDIGAYIGDTSIAYALAGATVHAFEAVPIFAEYAARNAKLNGLGNRIFVHPVALSNHAEIVDDLNEVRTIASMSHNFLPDDDLSPEIRLVDAVEYLRAHGVTKADVVKMNCEGGEYQILDSTRFLNFLSPEVLQIDYHWGSDPIRRVLAEGGYEVEDSSPGSERGNLFARRKPVP